jgi:hypothetical protein
LVVQIPWSHQHPKLWFWLQPPSVSCWTSDSFPCSLSILDGTEVWRYHQTNNSPRNGVSRCCFSVSLVDCVLWWQRVEQ